MKTTPGFSVKGLIVFGMLGASVLAATLMTACGGGGGTGGGPGSRLQSQWQAAKDKRWKDVYAVFSPDVRKACSYGKFLDYIQGELSGAEDLSKLEVKNVKVTEHGDTADVGATLAYDGQDISDNHDNPGRWVKVNGTWYDDSSCDGSATRSSSSSPDAAPTSSSSSASAKRATATSSSKSSSSSSDSSDAAAADTSLDSGSATDSSDATPSLDTGSGSATVSDSSGDYLRFSLVTSGVGYTGIGLNLGILGNWVDAEGLPTSTVCDRAASDLQTLRQETGMWPSVLSKPMSTAEDAYQNAVTDCRARDVEAMLSDMKRGTDLLSNVTSAFEAHCERSGTLDYTCN